MMTKFEELIIRDTYANKPEAGGGAGELFLPSDGFAVERDNGSSWNPYGPVYPFTTPISDGFSWDNQDTATVKVSNGGVYLYHSGGSGWHIRYKANPSVPYVITAGFIPNMYPIDYTDCGLCFRQSSDGKLAVFRMHHNAGSIELSVDKLTDSENWAGLYKSETMNMLGMGGVVWLRIEDNNSDRICSFSADGQNFIEFHSVGRTDHITADGVGYQVGTDQVTGPVGMTLLHWKEE